MKNEVLISSRVWNNCGGRMIKWIHNNIAEDCYKLRFTEPDKKTGNRDVYFSDVYFIFDSTEQAVTFKLVCFTELSEFLTYD